MLSMFNTSSKKLTNSGNKVIFNIIEGKISWMFTLQLFQISLTGLLKSPAEEVHLGVNELKHELCSELAEARLDDVEDVQVVRGQLHPSSDHLRGEVREYHS